MATDEILYYPQRLVMFTAADNCMFCEKPKGPSIVDYVYIQENMGFISCDLCKDQMKDAVNVWEEKVAYGRVNYLKESVIKIKRSSGDIDDGWKLGNPFIRLDSCNLERELVDCVDIGRDLQKWCAVDDIIRLNPPKQQPEPEPEPEHHKNLCIRCGVDMGPDNPRQLCNKTYCYKDEYE